MVKLGWLFTLYLGFSFILFLIASNTIIGAIIYMMQLLPFYGIILIFSWIHILQERSIKVHIPYRMWSLVFVLQVATILTSPGNCFGAKQGEQCYSNLQVWFDSVPRLGPSNVPHWQLVENAFPGLLFAYGVSVALSLLKTWKARY